MSQVSTRRTNPPREETPLPSHRGTGLADPRPQRGHSCLPRRALRTKALPSAAGLQDGLQDGFRGAGARLPPSSQMQE